jgi:hypothetical protein
MLPKHVQSWYRKIPLDGQRRLWLHSTRGSCVALWPPPMAAMTEAALGSGKELNTMNEDRAVFPGAAYASSNGLLLHYK